MLMPGDRRAESNPLSLIYRKLSQEEMKGPDRADAVSLSVSPLLSSFFMAWHICLKEEKCRCWLRHYFGCRRLFCQSEGIGHNFNMPTFSNSLEFIYFSFWEIFSFVEKWHSVAWQERQGQWSCMQKNWTQIQNCAGAWDVSQLIHLQFS